MAVEVRRHVADLQAFVARACGRVDRRQRRAGRRDHVGGAQCGEGISQGLRHRVFVSDEGIDAAQGRAAQGGFGPALLHHGEIVFQQRGEARDVAVVGRPVAGPGAQAHQAREQVDVVGCEFEGLFGQLQRLAGAAQFEARVGLQHQRIDALRLCSKHRFDGFDHRRVAAQAGQHVGQVEAEGGVVGQQAHRGARMLLGAIEVALHAQRLGEIGLHEGHVGRQAHGAADQRHRIGAAPGLMAQLAEQMQRVEVFRRGVQPAAQAALGLKRLAGFDQPEDELRMVALFVRRLLFRVNSSGRDRDLADGARSEQA